MKIRLLLAVADQEYADLLRSMLDAALRLVPLDVDVSRVRTREALADHVLLDRDDIVILDWDLAGEDTPDLVYHITRANPTIRVVALLPMQLRQYRQRLWEEGACSSIPRENMDQEWLSGMLCVVHREMCREGRLLSAASA
jgi:DNA-binding NarL/FixJ family response regulator